MKLPFKPIHLLLLSLFLYSFWWINPPAGILFPAWHLLGVFIATVLAIIFQILPLGMIAFVVVTLLPLTKTLTLEESLSGMSLPVVWLVVMAFFVARGIIKTGLGNRISYLFIALFGKKSLGLSYGLVAADTILSMAIPSNTARAGGILFPILKSLSQSFDSTPEQGTERKIGSFLFKSVFQANSVTSALFITAMASNSLAVKVMKEFNISISWGEWFLYASLPGLVSLITIPAIVYWLYPPTLKETPNAYPWAKKKLHEMGPMSLPEIIMAIVFLLLITLWIWGGLMGGLDNSLVAIMGVSLLLLCGVLDWQDIVGDKDAWGTFLWFSMLLMMATFLAKLGIISWIGELIKANMVGVSWPVAYIVLSLFYFYIHYLFASNTAHFSSLFVVVLAVGLGLKIPPYLWALTLAYLSALFGCLTHYATGPAPIFFGAGYVTIRDWWRIGFVVGLWHLIVWGIVGCTWWKYWGLW